MNILVQIILSKKRLSCSLLNLYVLDDPCKIKTCIANETCVKGKCKCGNADSCEGMSNGSYCDPENSICKCTNSLESCSENTTAPYCDAEWKNGTGICKCSLLADACTDISVDTCANEICQCEKWGKACRKPYPICMEGECGKL